MRRRFFLNNLSRTLYLAMLPILLLSIAHFFLSYWDLRSNTNQETLEKLELIQENITLMFDDSTKVVNFLTNQSLINSIKKTFSKSKMSYEEYQTYQHVVQHLRAIVKSSSYIDSIYVYIPNDQGLYLTSNANIHSYYNLPDKDWVAICEADSRSRFIRRQARLHTSLPNLTDYLTVVEKGPNGMLVAVNIKVSQFKRILGNSKLSKNQTVLITDQNNDLLLSSVNTSEEKELLDEISNTLPNRDWTAYNTRDSLILQSQSNSLGLNFIAIIPNKVAYNYLNRFISLSLLAGAVCLLLCIILSYNYASRNTKQVYFIIELLEAATRNQPLPDIPNTCKDDIYSYIITNIVQTFIQNNYLKTLLNERKFHTISLELSALQYQINPHFLSNTLQAIDFEIMRQSKGPTKANQMIGQLSQFLQYSLRSPKEDISVAEEVEATKIYIELMKQRYLNRFKVNWEIDPAVSSFSIPKLILQPMVENSIHYCMQITETPGLLQIRIHLKDDIFIISVSDNGPGVTPERLQEIQESLSHFEGFSQKHIGLQNIYRRLQLRFNMKCKVSLQSTPGQGFSITLSIPINEILIHRNPQTGITKNNLS